MGALMGRMPSSWARRRRNASLELPRVNRARMPRKLLKGRDRGADSDTPSLSEGRDGGAISLTRKMATRIAPRAGSVATQKILR